MSQNTPRLDLPRIQPAQAQKHVTHNSALELLDGITQLTVEARDATSPPSTPSEGQCFALGGAPTGDWVGQGDMLALRSNGGWMFVAPQDGWRLWDLQSETLCVRNAGAWVSVASDLQNVDGVGINTTADSTNRLAVSSDATLLTHDGTGGGHQLKVNKAGGSDTASLLFQTGYSGRAEMGTTGSDDFAIKVSPDGSAFTTALSFDAATGLATGEAVQQAPGDTTSGRLMRADYGYGPGNILGTVSESGGLPTGAVIESGQTSQGDYVRFADGTQICSDAFTLTYEGPNRIAATWDFPVPFFGAPTSVSGSINANSFLSNATPSLDELGGLIHSNTTSAQAKMIQYRVAGTTDFSLSDWSSARVLAIGRWF